MILLGKVIQNTFKSDIFDKIKLTIFRGKAIYRLEKMQASNYIYC